MVHFLPFLVELEYGNYGFGERKTEVAKENLLEPGREPTTNSTHTWYRRWNLNQRRISKRQVLSTELAIPCS